jgi:hypothetical protein
MRSGKARLRGNSLSPGGPRNTSLAAPEIHYETQRNMVAVFACGLQQRGQQDEQ